MISICLQTEAAEWQTLREHSGDCNRLDWELLHNGLITRYAHRPILDQDITWLRGRDNDGSW